MLDQPLEFFLQDLKEQFGYLEIIHQLGQMMYNDEKYNDLAGDMEKLRHKIMKINSKK